VFGAGRFYGDRVITPAIPAPGALERGETIHPDFTACMRPVSVGAQDFAATEKRSFNEN